MVENPKIPFIKAETKKPVSANLQYKSGGRDYPATDAGLAQMEADRQARLAETYRYHRKVQPKSK